MQPGLLPPSARECFGERHVGQTHAVHCRKVFGEREERSADRAEPD
jgi:hypothetical protein